MDCSIYVAKTKVLISCGHGAGSAAVTAQLICAFFLHILKAGFLIMQLNLG